ncbi:MAG: LacI family DNA-binding transcriptional regulator [Lachnospiraceae bacterium]|nr:LacI family DNA-binding transcriptional regulator [Lachnospiraceae bacterium]
MAKEVRMADIAKQLGVSTVTVSKALSDQKGVSEEMREKIKALAEELGYKSAAAAKKEAKRSYNMGVLIEGTYIERYASFYWEFYQKINTSASKENCFVILEVLSVEDEKNLVEPKILQENKIDGLMILGRVPTEYLAMLQKKSKVPVVYIDFYDQKIKGDSVISNSFYGAYSITNYLFEMGHRKIGFVGTIMATESIMDRYLGYQKAMIEHGEPIHDEWIIQDREKHIYIYEQLPLPKELPTAFVCNSDLTASRLIRSLRECGLQVPDDISVVGYDDYLYPGLCDVGITTYSVDMERMAKLGIDILVERINGSQKQFGMQVVEGDLVIRESTRRINNERFGNKR